MLSRVDPAIAQPARAFRRAQWRMLLATMLCYLFYYTGRQTMGFAIPGIEAELGLQKDQLGWLTAVLFWVYALGQGINGNLADRLGGRRMMSFGAIVSCGLNWVVSFGVGFGTLLVPWSLNGYVQAMGWAPGCKLVSNWWSRDERGMTFGLLVFAAGLASVLAYVTSLLVIDVYKALGQLWTSKGFFWQGYTPAHSICFVAERSAATKLPKQWLCVVGDLYSI